MLKSLVISTLLAAATLASTAAPASAMEDEVRCTKAMMKKLDTMVHATKDKAMMKMGMHEMEMAMSASQDRKFKTCRMHMMKAMEATDPHMMKHM